jgi:hypothetical protein
MGLIESGTPEDEYDPEVATIIAQLREATDARVVAQIVREEFVRWFEVEPDTPLAPFEAIAEEI